ncbi:hypothetical protein [Alkaliphilus peptidifermentans]|uniref:DUF4829 domain-containing protein n=1 Tax=Alkaliphilus peptidifermentans DSM 18978 TaxID=1120976 RepID=A0A1G5LCE6_9FIRM|nr:hypothetical protein [Alkaliphilus peptidifermentans]SCZ10613.1 hypothetical protein SAMN03080606_04300 [Alkaliphilus peptidifermentans DSM 18978]
MIKLKNQPILWIAVVLTLALVLTISFIANLQGKFGEVEAAFKESQQNYEDERAEWESIKENLTDEINKLNSALEEEQQSIIYKQHEYTTIHHLKALGFESSPIEIVEDLRSKPELIPFDGVLGGTMFFHEEVLILTHNWVFASFEDGHIGGYMILEYSFDEEKDIQWRIIEAELF